MILFIILSPFLTEIKLNESRNRVCNVMVHNPIYDGDGPVYESVQMHLQQEGNNETELNALSQFEDTTDERYYDNFRLSLNDMARYVDRPAQLQCLYTNTASNSKTTPINRSTSLSMPQTTPRVMALKKNGQERNKLHLTLSLGGIDSSNSEEAPSLSTHNNKHSDVTEDSDMDEPYTVMSPAGLI